MVAYSFQTQFAPDIQSGLKTHTIRGQRKRHARPGEALQLYCKMRRPDCFKIIPDPTCRFVDPINILFNSTEIISIWTGPDLQDEVMPRDLDAFARLDGFRDADAMHCFWQRQKTTAVAGSNAREFDGVIIGWGVHPLEVLYPSAVNRRGKN
ncbi:ASCH domain-containing protein [uncultured Tateyamaria sp.]|uniref:ASCH domain-containing protein n=1 Tax=uncultured Tateyamaria sp. TaxID=455651 RepID=UPI0026271DC0|nr:ASCH domain-containing protein [uncultured Tateyamaria sp.]